MRPDTHERAVQVPQGPDRIIDEQECEFLTTLSRTTRWRLMRKGVFPKKVRISPNRDGWWLSTVLTYLKDQEAAQ